MRETVLFNDGMRAKYEIVSLGRPFFFLSAAISRIFPSTSYELYFGTENDALCLERIKCEMPLLDGK